MGTIGMPDVIQQMRAVAEQAMGESARGPRSNAAGGFGQALSASIDRINDLQQAASSEAQAFEVGKPGVALSDVMIGTQEAGLAFQMGVQVRNRIINAYKEVMNMQV